MSIRVYHRVAIRVAITKALCTSRAPPSDLLLPSLRQRGLPPVCDSERGVLPPGRLRRPLLPHLADEGRAGPHGRRVRIRRIRAGNGAQQPGAHRREGRGGSNHGTVGSDLLSQGRKKSFKNFFPPKKLQFSTAEQLVD